MILKPWEQLPDEIRTDAVKPYYDVLNRHRTGLILKRVFDLFVSAVMLVVLFPVMLLIGVAVRLDTPGQALFFQERVTTYGRHFMIWKFRTMRSNTEKQGTQVTVSNDSRITKVGRFLRKFRLDELPQLVNILRGDMSFVGTRPEVVRYVKQYRPEYYATLLTPAGVTSEASIRYKDEDKLLAKADDVDRVYVEEVLPAKMVWNLESVMRFRFLREILTMIRTILAILGKDYH